MFGPFARRAAMGDDDRRLSVQGRLRRHRLSAAAGDQQQRQRRDAPAPHPAKRACQSPSENPTLTPSAASTTGRRIIAGWSSISALALAASRSALSVSASLRKVVPLLLSSLSQPTASIQPCSLAGSSPSLRKSWKRWETPAPSSQRRAFFTVSQFGMP